MTTFADARLGDRIELKNLPRQLVREGTWAGPLLLVSAPVSCGTPGCEALRCDALTEDGRQVPLHRLGWRPIDVLEPAVGRWSAADEPDSFRDRADYDDTPNDEGDNA